MPSPHNRRMRFVAVTAVIVFLIVIYITTGAQQTRNSRFYTRTMRLMEDKAQAKDIRDEQLKNTPAALREEVVAQIRPQQRPIMEEEEDTLKLRLKHAEVAAKKSADDKWRDMHGDANKAILKEKADAAKKAKVANNEGVHQPKPAYADEHEEIDEYARRRKHATHSTSVRTESARATASAIPDADAGHELEHILKLAPVVIFSKSYCPYSAKAKRILTIAFTITPKPYIVELDKHELGPELQELLLKKTGRRTVPNVLVKGQSIGGGDEIEELWKENRLKGVIKKLGGKDIENIHENLDELEDHGES